MAIAEQATERSQHADERGRKLLAFFNERDYYPGVEFLSAELALHEQEVIDDARLDKAVEDALQGFRDWMVSREVPPVSSMAASRPAR